MIACRLNAHLLLNLNFWLGVSGVEMKLLVTVNRGEHMMIEANNFTSFKMR